MTKRVSRRGFLRAAGAVAAVEQPRTALRERVAPLRLPHLCLGVGARTGAKQLRKLAQLGIDHVLMAGPPPPWTEQELRERIERFGQSGFTISNLRLDGLTKTIYGREGRDDEIEAAAASIRAAGRVGLPVIEYNFYAHRLTEGYHEVAGRGGAGMTAFDYDRVKDLPPVPEVGVHSAKELWSNLRYFLEAVVPVAEASGVRLALHPNDPPVPVSRGSEQVMATLDDWKKLVALVPSPANGLTYDCGVTCELGEDPVAVCRYFGERDRINHVHFRNVQVRRPRVDYVEVFPDEGDVDMFGVMRELVRLGYTGAIYPEHPRALDVDRQRPDFNPYYPGGGGYTGEVYNVAHAQAMLQAASG